jgi:hypothetical protein
MTASIVEIPPIAVPLVGTSFNDPVFGTSIRRITQAPQGKWIGTEYPTVCPYSCDGKFFILLCVDHFALYNSTGFIRDLSIGASDRPRWSRVDPNVIYYLSANKIMALNISTLYLSAMRVFTKFKSIDDYGEADVAQLDNGGCRRVVCGDGRLIFVYDLSKDITYPALDTGGRIFDSLYLTSRGETLVSWGEKGTGRFQGIELFDTQMDFVRQLTNSNGHKCVTTALDGSPLLVWTNSDEANADPLCPNGIQSINLRTFTRQCLLPLPWSLACHISPGPGFVLVETYSEPGGDWVPYRDELIKVPLDGSPITRLCHHRSNVTTYTAQPKSVLSRDGERALFSSNLAAPGMKEYCDVYELELAPVEQVSVQQVSTQDRITFLKSEIARDQAELARLESTK